MSATETPKIALRDYFAGKCLIGLLADPEGCPSPEIGARLAYTWAEAMLAERERRESK